MSKKELRHLIKGARSAANRVIEKRTGCCLSLAWFGCLTKEKGHEFVQSRAMEYLNLFKPSKNRVFWWSNPVLDFREKDQLARAIALDFVAEMLNDESKQLTKEK